MTTCQRAAFALSVLVLSIVDWPTTVQAETSPLRREFYGQPGNSEFFAEFLDGHARKQRDHRRDNGLGFASGSSTHLVDNDNNSNNDNDNDNDNNNNAVDEWSASSKSIALLPTDRELLERFVKRNIDEIDRTAFDNFFKRNVDEIGRVGWNGFVKRLADYLTTNRSNVLARRG